MEVAVAGTDSRQVAEARFSQGTIRKRGGEWQAVVTYHDADGAKHIKTKLTGIACDPEKAAERGHRGRRTDPTGRGAAKAKAALAEWRAALVDAEAAEIEGAAAAQGRPADPAGVTVGEYVSTFVEQRVAAGIIEASTAKAYRGSQRYIEDRLQDVTLADLSPAIMRDLEAGLTTDGYSSSTVGKVHRLLRLTMGQAVNDGILDKDPTRGVKPPKRKQSHPNAYDANGAPEVVRFLDSLPEETYTTIAARLALFCGLRRGEICGLKWSDLRFDFTPDNSEVTGGTLWVRRSIGEGRGGTYVKDAKTDRVRDVPMPVSLAKRLILWKGKCAVDVVALGGEFESQYVIGKPDGTYRDPVAVSRSWTVLAKVIGIKGTEGRVPTLHGLRHSYATVAISAGVDVKTVSSALGHSNAAMTLNIYASADPNAKRAAAGVIDSAYAPKDKVVSFPAKTGTDD